MQVGGEDKLRVVDPLDDGVGLHLDHLHVLLEEVREVAVQVKVVGVHSGKQNQLR